MNTITRTQVICGGYHAVEYFRDSDNQVAYWFGLLRDAPLAPPESEWRPISVDTSPDPFDLACERRLD